MIVKRLLHAAVLVTDLGRAKRFYTGLLGLNEKPRPDFDFPGAWYDLGDCELHLQCVTEPLPEIGEWPRLDRHVAFQIDDYDAVKAELLAAGIKFREGTSGLPQIFVRDPDGNLVELQSRR